MTYKIKKKRGGTPKPEYFREREIKDLAKETKGKPTYKQISRASFRRALGIHKRIYKKGLLVEYQGNPAQVKKVTKQGITIQTFKKGKEGFPEETKKEKFVSVNEIEQGKVYPYFTGIPDLVFLAQFGRK